ncbi:MAG: hypothetical protein KTR31_25420 [Myxococcales bacterium]|nr:hypothetical protein [Myxococcales bacterium]
MRTWIVLLVAGCGGSSTTPTEPVPETDTPVDTGFAPEGAVVLTTEVMGHDACEEAQQNLTVPSLSVNPRPNHKLEVRRLGWTDACACDGPIRAWMDAEASTIDVWFDYGTCAVAQCCESLARIHRVPNGTWTVRLWGMEELAVETVLQ